MNAPALSDLAPLPAAITAALEAFGRAYDCTDVRLWSDDDGKWSNLFPGGDGAPEPTSLRLPLALSENVQLELEAVGGTARDADLEFLAHTVQQILSFEREARSAARELTERYEEINLLYFISEILGSVLSIPDAAHWILAEVADVLSARRASLWVLHPDDQKLHLAAAVGEEGLTGPIPIDDPDSATAWVFREKQPLNIERGSAAKNLPRLEPRPLGREAFLSVPINYTPPGAGNEPRTVGVITLVGRRSNVRFNAGDARLLAAIASQIGAALETQRLVQESLRQERMVRELELAHDLQLKLLPDVIKVIGKLNVAARCAPADSVGGDFYQIFRLSGDRVGIMIGDVSSHGFSAALIMALAISAAAIYAQQAGPPAEVLRNVHQALKKELESTEMYLTLFYCVLDPEAGRLTYANAGHPHAFLIPPDGKAQRLGATDPPMGIVPLDQYHEATVDWNWTDDLLCLFTDGLSDAFTDGKDSGERSLVQEVKRARKLAPAEILEKLFARAEQATLIVPPDDRSAVLVRG
ncbi:MAG: GAF domain-containing SpoIIE family protein phosphatase [Gemmatimonadota bacterium]